MHTTAFIFGGMMMPEEHRMKYLFFDIDGTLYSHNTGLVPSAAAAIAETRARGNKCFIATGRHLGSLHSVEGLEMDGIIYCNGGGIFMDGRTVSSEPIPHDVLSRTVFASEEREGGYSLMTHDRAFVNELEVRRRKRACELGLERRDYAAMVRELGMVPFTEYRSDEILKIDIGFASEEIMDDFLRVMDPSLKLASTAGYNISLGRRSGEITRADVSKGAAIVRLMEMIGGSMEDTFAFGDSNNDLEMLEMAGTGIAMGNGFAEVKLAADYITRDIDDDGIAFAMRHFGLIG